MSELARWLEGLGLGQHAATLAQNDVDVDVLPHLSDEDLKELGLSLGHRRKLLAAIAGMADTGCEAAPESAGERRQVTILFADLTGFTRLTGSLDAEETHALLNRYFDAVDRVIKSYGGHIDKHIGDAVMAIFGAPTAHSDDPERAVRAALDIHAAVGALDPPLQAHAGIASGQVVASGTGSAAHREYTVVGDSVNLAARLTDMADTGETLISDTVARALGPAMDADVMTSVAVDGFAEAQTVWRLRGLHRSDQAPGVPITGRRRERQRIDDVFDACIADGRGRVVQIRGEPGIGKTRLVAGIQEMAAARRFSRYASLMLDFGAGKGQDAIRALAQGLAGVPATGTADERAQAADAAIRSDDLSAADAAHLYDLLDTPPPPDLHALYDAMDSAARRTGRHRVLSDLVIRASADQAVLLCVEDVHWADRAALGDLAALARAIAACPAALILTSRIDGDPIDDDWLTAAGHPTTITIHLGPLDETDARALAEQYPELDHALVDSCIARAAGNPLFLDQLLQSADASTGETIPGSVQSVIQARIDMLEPQDKQALQAAAVLGQRFELEPLRHLIDDAAYDGASLAARQLIQRRGTRFLFAHALVRDCVYGTLLRDRRQHLHRQAASWFSPRDLDLKAQHLDRADDPGAAAAYLATAREEMAGYHFDAALRLSDRALELKGEDAVRADLLCLKGELLRHLGRSEESLTMFEQALGIASDDEQRARGWLGRAYGMRMLDRHDDALAALSRAEAVAQATGSQRILAEYHHLLGNLLFPLGDIDGCLEQHQLALTSARAATSKAFEARALGGLGDAYYARGHMATASQHFNACITLSRANGFGQIEVANLHMRGSTWQYRLELSDALADGRDAAEAAAQVGNYRAEIVARGGCAGWVLWDMGELDAALEELDRALTLSRQIGARRFESFSLSFQAKIAARQDRTTEAITLAREAVAVSRETSMTFTGPMNLGALALVTDDDRVKREALDEGEDILKRNCVSHNYLWFYRDAMETCLAAEDWTDVERYADALAAYTAREALPWSDFFMARGRALAAYGRGLRDDVQMARLRRLYDQARQTGLGSALPALAAALDGTAGSAP